MTKPNMEHNEHYLASLTEALELGQYNYNAIEQNAKLALVIEQARIADALERIADGKDDMSTHLLIFVSMMVGLVIGLYLSRLI